MGPSPTDPLPESRAEDLHVGPVLGYAARPAGAKRLWRWIRPGSVLFFVLVTALAAGVGWGVWNWRLAADRKAFEGCATIYSVSGATQVTFDHAPSRGALRHLSRLPGLVLLIMEWPESENALAAPPFGVADLGNVMAISMRNEINADLLLKELSRPDSGLKSLTTLNLAYTQVTDAGLKELARPDCGLKALTTLGLFGTKVTDAGVKALQAARPGLRIGH